MLQTPFPMLLCRSLTYNAKEITMHLRVDSEGEDPVKSYKVEWIIIDPAGFTGTHTHTHQHLKQQSSANPTGQNQGLCLFLAHSLSVCLSVCA